MRHAATCQHLIISSKVSFPTKLQSFTSIAVARAVPRCYHEGAQKKRSVKLQDIPWNARVDPLHPGVVLLTLAATLLSRTKSREK